MYRLLPLILSAAGVCPGRLAIVSTPDGLLARPEVAAAMAEATARQVHTGTALELRVHYELHVRPSDSGAQWLYILTGPDPVLPDIATHATLGTVACRDLFANFDDIDTIVRQPTATLERLLAEPAQGRVSAKRLQWLLNSREEPGYAADDNGTSYNTQDTFDSPTGHPWGDVQTILTISTIFCQAVRNGKWQEIEGKMAELGRDFFSYLQDAYPAAINASPYLAPKSVQAIVPHIRHSYTAQERIALVVVDGMAFWQYTILKGELRKLDICPKEERWTYSWIPSITMLSRQAIFRGAPPLTDYKQSPQSERKLWAKQWDAVSQAPLYLYDGDSVEVAATCRRLALVTMQLDEKMHASSCYKDLLTLTENWAPAFAATLAAIRQQGFTILLTTDHGNTLATGCGGLTQQDKLHLYADGSRGHRHAIFRTAEAADHFAQSRDDTTMYHRDLWFALADDTCFATNGKSEITHGGAHFFEVMIPYIKI